MHADRDPEIVHVLTTDVPDTKLEVLATLCRSLGKTTAMCVAHFGPGPCRAPDGLRVVSMQTLPGMDWHGRLLLRRALRELGPRPAGEPPLLHAWSARAGRYCRSLAEAGWPLVIEVELGEAPERHVVWPHSGRSAHLPTYICPAEAARAGLRKARVPADRTVLIRPGADAQEASGLDRAAARARLQLREEDIVIAALPPVSRSTGTIFAAWAAILLEKVCPAARIVVPAGGPEVDRVRRLVAACHHEWVVRFAPPAFTMPELVAAADLAAYLPPRTAPLTAVVQAMAAGCPLVATDVPAVRELLVHGETAWLCQAGEPEDAARWLLRAIEEPETARRHAARAREIAAETLTGNQMVAHYRACYAARREETLRPSGVRGTGQSCVSTS